MIDNNRRDSVWSIVMNTVENWEPDLNMMMSVEGITTSLLHYSYSRIDGDPPIKLLKNLFVQSSNPFHVKLLSLLGNNIKLSRSYNRSVRNNFYWKSDVDWIYSDVSKHKYTIIDPTPITIYTIWLNGIYDSRDDRINCYLPIDFKKFVEMYDLRLVITEEFNLKYGTSITFTPKPTGRGINKYSCIHISGDISGLLDKMDELNLPSTSILFNR